MNWDALGAIAELVGALAVLATLGYLTIQVRHALHRLEAQAEDEVRTRVFDAYNPVYEGNNVSVLRRALSGDELSQDEEFTFLLLMHRQLAALDFFFYHFRKGDLSDSSVAVMQLHYKEMYAPSERAMKFFESRIDRESLEILGLTEPRL